MWLFMHVWMRVYESQRTTLAAIYLPFSCLPGAHQLGESDLANSVSASQGWGRKRKRIPGFWDRIHDLLLERQVLCQLSCLQPRT